MIVEYWIKSCKWIKKEVKGAEELEELSKKHLVREVKKSGKT